MMIIRTCKLAVIILLQWLILVGGIQAAEETGKKPVEKQALVKKPKVKKVKHPCARKSAQQLNKYAKPFLKSIHMHAKASGVDSELVKSVITVESCYMLKAKSPKGAQGLMQLIPDTAERFGISDPYDSHQNIKGGARYLGWLSKRFDGDLSKVLAGYNAGEGKVDRYNGIPPYRETQHYVHDVLVVYKKLKEHQNSAQAKPAATTRQKPVATTRQKPIATTRQKPIATTRQKPIAATRQKPVAATRQKPVAAKKKPDPALTPAQRQHQLNQRRQQLARQHQIRQQKQAQARRQWALRQQQALRKQQQASLKTRPGTVVGKPGKPVYAPKPQQKPPPKPQQKPPPKPQQKPPPKPQQPAQSAYQIVIGKPAIPEPVRKMVQKPVAKKPVIRPAVRPVFRKVRAVIPRQPVNHLQAQINRQDNNRVKNVFPSPVKPGRGGWMANKALAPQLFKQQ